MDVGLAACITISKWVHVAERVPTGERSEDGTGLAHARWMLDEVMRRAGEWKNDKLNRWLGYAQSLLVQNRVLSLEEVKRCNLQA